MFEEIIIIIGFLLFSFLISYLLLTYTPEPLNKMVKALAITGIIIHELCHIAMCVITNTRIESINLIGRLENKEKDTNNKDPKYDYYGNVRINGNKRITFLQALLIGLAPLFVSFWLFFYLLEQLFNPQLNIFLFFLYTFIMISIAIAAAPSLADVRTIPNAFKNDPRYSMYQIFLSVLSILLIWVLINIYQLSFFLFHEVINYVLIMITYYVFKYSFRGINQIIYKISSRNRRLSNRSHHFKRYTRRRFRPTKPRKLGKEEAHW
jgi:hypothetical protein